MRYVNKKRNVKEKVRMEAEGQKGKIYTEEYCIVCIVGM
jgi:hypothetical protein